ncbi:MAG: hypothetical protein PUC12_11380 [Clostridiales bacterium]|nr:hypothetical protein [Clostridiales bacterium]
MFIILLVFISTFTAMDINNLRNGIGGYIQRPSGMLFTIVVLMVIPMVVFDLKGAVEVWVTIILEVVYITFYTWVYFKIKKIREERKNNKKEGK